MLTPEISSIYAASLPELSRVYTAYLRSVKLQAYELAAQWAQTTVTSKFVAQIFGRHSVNQ